MTANATINTETEQLQRLFYSALGVAPTQIRPLSAHASKRRMFRLQNDQHKLTTIAVVNDNHPENDAFVAFASRFFEAGLPVPNVLGYAREHGMYLVEDLGNQTLYDKICAHSPTCCYSDALLADYLKITYLLPQFQAQAAALINVEDCFEGAYFDADAAVEDIDAFYNYFLQLALPDAEWQTVRQELAEFAAATCHPEEFEFMHRDFQSRNIMLRDGEPVFIDFQSGRFGPPQYDLASLLYQAQAQIPNAARETLLNHYLNARQDFGPLNREQFINRYYQIVVLRQIQVLSAYGRLGLSEGKTYFLESIPLALNNLKFVQDLPSLNNQLPHFKSLVAQLRDKFCNRTGLR